MTIFDLLTSSWRQLWICRHNLPIDHLLEEQSQSNKWEHNCDTRFMISPTRSHTEKVDFVVDGGLSSSIELMEHQLVSLLVVVPQAISLAMLAMSCYFQVLMLPWVHEQTECIWQLDNLSWFHWVQYGIWKQHNLPAHRKQTFGKLLSISCRSKKELQVLLWNVTKRTSAWAKKHQPDAFFKADTRMAIKAGRRNSRITN